MKNYQQLECAFSQNNFYGSDVAKDAKRVVMLSHKINMIDEKMLNGCMTEDELKKVEKQRKKALREAALICGLYNAFVIYNPEPKGCPLWVRWERDFPEDVTCAREEMDWMKNTPNRGIPAI